MKNPHYNHDMKYLGTTESGEDILHCCTCNPYWFRKILIMKKYIFIVIGLLIALPISPFVVAFVLAYLAW